MLGMHGFYEANMAMHHSDCILAVGARFDDRVTNTADQILPGRQDHSHRRGSGLDFQDRAWRISLSSARCSRVLTEMLAQIDVLREKAALPDQAALARWWQQIEEWRARHGLFTGRRYEPRAT